MAYITDTALDALLNAIQDYATRLDICTQEPTTYGEATTEDAYSCGYKTGISISEPSDATGGGRKITISAITDGTVSCTGTVTATHWALTNGSDTLYATGSLASSQQVTDGNTFTLTAFDITVPDATSE